MKDKLLLWSLKHNIHHNALSDLLKNLSPDYLLPKDFRTLLGTRSSVAVNPMKDVYGRCGEYGATPEAESELTERGGVNSEKEQPYFDKL